MKRKALYPGSFDPLTLGHLDLIRRGLLLFDEVTVGVVINPGKNPFFSVEERMQQIRQATRGLKKVKIEAFDGLLIDYVKAKGRVDEYRGSLQLSIGKIRKVVETDRQQGFREDDCVVSTPYDID